ncbi:MAG: hypothetical protein OXG24_05785 [Gammaproteobacteria bacterium]|nr:hypothetical protein [Gammaproteobacteria bacterium]
MNSLDSSKKREATRLIWIVVLAQALGCFGILLALCFLVPWIYVLEAGIGIAAYLAIEVYAATKLGQSVPEITTRAARAWSTPAS